MSHGSGHPADHTGEAAVGDMSSDSLFTEVLSRIEHEEDRVLLLAHIGLEISVRSLSRTLGVSAENVTARIAGIVATLREDKDLAAKLQDVRRAGRTENYQALAFALGLQDWFCSWCGQFLVRSETGVMRKTCSGRCRTRLSRAHGVGWKNGYRARSSSSAEPARDDAARWVAPPDAVLRKLVEPMDVRKRPTYFWYLEPKTFWWQPDTRLRDRAAVLLGFTCPVGLTPKDLAGLDANDLVRTARGMEIRLRLQDRGKTRYITVPAREDPAVCPVAALVAWKGRLARAGHVSGPLFVKMDEIGRLPAHPSRLHALTMARIFTQVGVHAVGQDGSPRATPSTLLPSYLSEIGKR